MSLIGFYFVGFAIFAVILSICATSALSDEYNAGVYPVDSKPFGHSYGEWSGNWWKWFSLIPLNMNPTTDQHGENCNVGQNDPNMFFLGLTQGEPSVDRTCTMPAGKSIFIPLLANNCDYSEVSQKGKTNDELAACAKELSDPSPRGLVMSLVIDGKPVSNLEHYRSESPPFNVTYPENSIYQKENVTAGTYPSVVNGYFVIHEPLPTGLHEITIVAKNDCLPIPKKNTQPTCGHTIHDPVNYHLTVK